MQKKLFKLILKIALSALAVYLVIDKIDMEKTKAIFASINYGWLVLGFLVFTLSRVVGARRLNLYFSQTGLKLSEVLNLKLYYLGMFYNLFLPGGIGGDGYKIFFLNRHFQVKKIPLLKATLLDRVSGLFALIFLAAISLIFSSFITHFGLTILWPLVVAILIFPLSYLFNLLLFKAFIPIFKSSTIYAILLQGLQVLSALFILYALNENAYLSDYMTIFLISSVVAVLPVSIGGIGARELTFVYLLEFLHRDYNIGVALSVLFFLFTFFSSLWGALYMHLKP
jgi:uncharacterized membrane protein YbhN (UPF0104 family)